MHLWGGDKAQDGTWVNRSEEQNTYMREVRERTWGKLPQLGAFPMHDSRAYSVQSPK
jgi:hypothetical protein